MGMMRKYGVENRSNARKGNGSSRARLGGVIVRVVFDAEFGGGQTIEISRPVNDSEDFDSARNDPIKDQ